MRSWTKGLLTLLAAWLAGLRAFWPYGQGWPVVNARAVALIAAAMVAMAAVPVARGADAAPSPAAAAAPEATPGGPPIRLLVLGDSLTAGFGLPWAQAFPAQLERALRTRGRDVTVIDAGVSGDTSAGGLARLPWVLGSTPAEAPDAVIVELGGNDVLRGFAPPTTTANLDAILAELKRRSVPTLVAGMRAPPNLGAEYEREFNAIYPELARRYGTLLFPFFLEGVAGLPPSISRTASIPTPRAWPSSSET